jgi:hypothetical protein
MEDSVFGQNVPLINIRSAHEQILSEFPTLLDCMGNAVDGCNLSRVGQNIEDKEVTSKDMLCKLRGAENKTVRFKESIIWRQHGERIIYIN